MQRYIIRLSFALVTFTTLLASPPASPRPNPGESIRSRNQELSADEPAQSSSLSEDLIGKGGADLSIVVAIAQPNPNRPSLETRPIKLSKSRRTVMQLHLGEDLDNQELILNFSDNSVEYRVFQRYRTSMSIANEGPHLDLVDWRHFDSPWSQLPSFSPGRFRTLRSDQMDSAGFPRTTQSEILDEVRRQVGHDSPFVDVARTCHGPTDGACWVGISSIYLRFQKHVRGSWIDVGLVEFRLPMGC